MLLEFNKLMCSFSVTRVGVQSPIISPPITCLCNSRPIHF